MRQRFPPTRHSGGYSRGYTSCHARSASWSQRKPSYGWKQLIRMRRYLQQLRLMTAENDKYKGAPHLRLPPGRVARQRTSAKSRLNRARMRCFIACCRGSVWALGRARSRSRGCNRCERSTGPLAAQAVRTPLFCLCSEAPGRSVTRSYRSPHCCWWRPRAPPPGLQWSSVSPKR